MREKFGCSLGEKIGCSLDEKLGHSLREKIEYSLQHKYPFDSCSTKERWKCIENECDAIDTKESLKSHTKGTHTQCIHAYHKKRSTELKLSLIHWLNWIMSCSALPPGWRREEIIRRSGLSAGKIDVFYYRLLSLCVNINQWDIRSNIDSLPFISNFVSNFISKKPSSN